jgi:hypothetical protein
MGAVSRSRCLWGTRSKWAAPGKPQDPISRQGYFLIGDPRWTDTPDNLTQKRGTTAMDTYILMDEKGPELKELGSELARIEKEAILLFRKRLDIWLMLSDSPAEQYYMRVHGSGDTFLCYIEQWSVWAIDWKIINSERYKLGPGFLTIWQSTKSATRALSPLLWKGTGTIASFFQAEAKQLGNAVFKLTIIISVVTFAQKQDPLFTPEFHQKTKTPSVSNDGIVPVELRIYIVEFDLNELRDSNGI